MKIPINEIPPQRILIEINPKDYFLKKLEQGDDFNGDYALVHRIDMSYCGKADQEGGEFIYLNDKEAERLKGLIDEIV